MIRSAAFRRPMSRLALLAVLLLALVPTLGRLAQARATGADDAPAWAALCTVRGLASVRLDSLPPDSFRLAQGPHGATDAGGAPASPHGSGDCEYCPLLAVAIPTAFALAIVPPMAPPPALCTFPALPARQAPHPCGLGSRGPPTVS